MGFKVPHISTYLAGGWQAYRGPGVLEAAVMDGTDLSSNVLTLYDSDRENTGDPVVSTWTTDTDFGTTVPVSCFKDGSVVATLATVSANTKFGVPFFRGLFVNKTGDTTHNAAIKLLVRPLVKKEANLGHGATTDDQQLFIGPGRLVAVRLIVDGAVVTLGTMDITFKDGANTIVTATNYATAGPSLWAPVTTTGIDDVGAAVTTAATGAYTNPGVNFLTGLSVVMAQGSATPRNAQVEVLVDRG